MNNNRTIGILFFSLIVLSLIAALTLNYKDLANSFKSQVTKEEACEISENDLCDGKIVQIKGIVESAKITPEYGFRLINTTMQNPLYITAVRYNGKDIVLNNQTKEYVQIPYGQSIIVRGMITASEVARCTQRDYALENPEECKPGKARVRITPTSIITENKSLSNQYRYSIQGSLKEFQSTVTTCPEIATLCEDNTNACYKISLDRNYCNTITNARNSFVVTGYAESMQTPLKPMSMTAYSGISFTSREVDEELENRITRLTPSQFSKIGIFDQEGKLLTHITQSNTNYYNLDKVTPTTSGGYYFDENTIYFQANNHPEPQKIKAIDNSLIEYADDLASAKLSPDESFFIARISKEISSQPLGNTNYMLRKNNYKLVKIPLDTNSPIETVFEKDVEGFMSLISYDFKNESAVVEYQYDSEQTNNCKKTRIHKIDVKTKNEIKLFEEITEGNNNCTDIMYSVLYTSPDGNTVISGKDVNPIVGGNTPDKLVIDTLTQNNTFSRKEVLADGYLLESIKYKVTGITPNTLNIYMPSFPYLLYAVDLKTDYISFDSLKPRLNLNSKQRFPEYAENTTTLSEFERINNIQYIHETKDHLYLRVRNVTEYSLYKYTKRTNTMLLMENFSALSKFKIADGKMYTVDFVK